MNQINKIFITLLTIEIVVGGGGRLLDPFNLPPLRYFLFAIAIFIFALNLVSLNARFKNGSLVTILMILALPIYGCLIGVLNGNGLSDIAFDLQPYLYIFILFYLCSLNDKLTEHSLTIFISATKIFSVFASVVYICYVLLLKGGVLNFNSLYNSFSLTQEFIFRPSGAFFAKSFFFIGIGALFFFIEKKYFLFVFSMVALFLTETRGVFLFAGIAVLLASLRLNGAMKNAAYIGLALAAGFALMILVGDRAGDSDSVRVNDFNFVIGAMDGLASIFGHGFGTQILDRGRIEVVPLELLYKTGVFGLVLSAIPIVILSLSTLIKSYTIRKLQIVCALIFAAGVSITNPFLYTPMGIFVIAMAINSNKKSS
ncbi:oligosaccharide repeat unit polymerase [Leclercia sp. S52]|uniref:oligosaccharide repeat unit polymerase n=1 Tax=Leclercia sp. S52 TaxID=3138178 RepID=UPI00321BA29F